VKKLWHLNSWHGQGVRKHLPAGLEHGLNPTSPSQEGVGLGSPLAAKKPDQFWLKNFYKSYF